MRHQVKGAEYWNVDDLGEGWYRFEELHTDDGYWTRSDTAVGAYTWRSAREAVTTLRAMTAVFHAIDMRTKVTT